MSTGEDEEIDRLRDRLKIVTNQFERAMRERGYDPEQAENVPLGPPLADLYLEQITLRSKLIELTEEEEL